MNDIELIENAIGIKEFVKIKQRLETSSKFIKYNLKRNKPLQGTDKTLVNLCAVLKLIGIKFDLLKIKQMTPDTIQNLNNLISHYLNNK
jgi:hypothetical protein